MSITMMFSRVIRPVVVVAVLATVLGISGGSSMRPPLLQADGATPPVLGPCPCSDARCLPLCHNNVPAPSAQAVSAELPSVLPSSVQLPSAPSSSVSAPSALVAMETPPVACPCSDARCLPLCHAP
jgi:hypothetical protein